jgi:hypothetical protein
MVSGLENIIVAWSIKILSDDRFCKTCAELDPSRAMTMKPPPRKSGRKKNHAEPSDTAMTDVTQPPAETASATTAILEPDLIGTAAPMPTSSGGVELNKWIAIAESKVYIPDSFRRMNGSDIGLEWILSDENAMKEPIVVENPEGLGMKMPGKEMTVRDVAREVGPDTHVEVIGALTLKIWFYTCGY